MAVDTATKQASLINFGTPYYVILPWVDASAVEEQQHFLNLFAEPLAAGAAAPDPASSPDPADLATDVPLSQILSWSAGAGADSHDVYFGTNPTPGVGQFQGNQAGVTFDPGPLLEATTYYWRIDEVNEAGTTTGSVWSFSTLTVPVDPPEQAANPSPSDLATSQPISTTTLSWDPASGADSYDVYFGLDDTPDATEFQGNQAGTTFDPGLLSYATTYYWQIDTVNAGGTTTGLVWSFTTEDAPVGGVPENPAAGYSDLLKAWWDL